jgi:DNA-binding CsgD family transcriptional regulator/N-acetylneuraminic acid mutarotase
MAERGEPLSDRELDVLTRLAAGESNKTIADGLSISPYTVKTHLRNIYAKLDVSTRTEAMTVALQQGVLPMPGEAAAVGNSPVDLSDGASSSTIEAIPDPPAEHPLPERHRGPVRRWRALSLALLALLVLVVALFAYMQWRTGGAPIEPAEAPFVEQPIGETRWMSSRPLPEARAGRATTAVGLDVYVIGGETDAGVSDDVRVFDTLQRTWRRAAAKPTAVSAVTAGELFGEIYVPGGVTADGAPTDIVEAYSPSQDAWRRLASLPQALAGGLAVADGGFLYVFGGRNEEGVLDTAYVYDPGADSWRPIAPLPEPRTGAAGGALTGRLYVVGGSDGTTERDSCYEYDPAADEWADCPSMLRPRAGAGATVLINKLYVIGGTEQGAEPSAAHGEVYDPNSRTWTVLNAPPGGAWTEPGVTHVEARIYALGGRRGETLSDATLVYSPLAFQTFIPAAPSDAEE